MTKPRVTSIRFFTSPTRKMPHTGDLRETKKHGKQVRMQERAMDRHGVPFAMVVQNGRPVYEWVSYDEAVKRGCGFLLPKGGA